MANHLTPTELAREAGLERRDVIVKCVELGVPIFNGRIDKTLFLSSLREIAELVQPRPGGKRLTLPTAGRRRPTASPAPLALLGARPAYAAARAVVTAEPTGAAASRSSARGSCATPGSTRARPRSA